MLPLKIKNLKVITGKGRGKKLGIPTLNFSLPLDIATPFGVYAGWLYLNNHRYPAAIHYGPRPVFGEKDISLETYILDSYEGYTHRADLEFIKFIREITNFSTPSKMIEQIEKDIKEIKKELFPEIGDKYRTN